MQPKTDSFGDKGDNMKGKTIIELKDVRSGKVQRVEHGNTFQSAVLEKLFTPLGSLGVSLISGSANQWQSLVGGLLVFDDTIEVGTQYPPANVNMVANGAYNVQNNTDPVELGTWNESESYVSSNEIVMTYDFSTSQGNGRINSVCLTSNVAGKAGIGNASQTRLPQNDCVQPYMGDRHQQSYMPRITGDTCMCTDGQYYYYLSKSGATITVKKRWANISGIDLIKGAGVTTYDDVYTITVPSDYANQEIRYATQITESKIVFILNRSSNYTAIVVDIANRNVSSEITIPMLGNILAVTGAYPLEVAQIHTDNDVTYVSIYDTDSAQWIKDFETSMTPSDVLKIGDRYYFSDISYAYMYSANSNILCPLNTRWLVASYLGHGSYLPTLDKIQQGADYAGLDAVISIPAFYLATINNLESEIVKDNTKTMKITYVLTRR